MRTMISGPIPAGSPMVSAIDGVRFMAVQAEHPAVVREIADGAPGAVSMLFVLLFVLESDVLGLFLFQKQADLVRVNREIILFLQIIEEVKPVLMIPGGVVFFHKVHRNRRLCEFLEVAFRLGKCFCHFLYPFRI